MIQTIRTALKRPAAAWLAGWFCVLLCGVGLIYYWRVAYSFAAISAGMATALVCGGFSVLYLLVFLTAHFIRQDFALKAAILLFVAGLGFVFANPPLQAPDETMHFLRAYSIASGHFYYDQNEDFPTDVDLLVADFPGNYNFAFPLTEDTSIADAFARYQDHLAEGNTEAENASTPVQQFLPYLPQAAGIALGRLLGANALVCLYLCRITNLLCYALLCYWGIRFAARFRAIFTALCCVPIGLFMAASASSDGLLLGLQWLFIGICLTDRLDTRKAVLLAVSFGILFNAKYNYLALAPLVFLPNCGEISLRKHKLTGKKVLAALFLACAGVAAAAWLLQTAHTTWFSNYDPLAYYDPSVRPADQLRFILSNPLRYLAVFVYSIYLNKGELFSIGVFGWRDMPVPFVSYFAPLVLLLAAAFSAYEAALEPRRTGFLFFLSSALLYGFTYTGMYLTSTPYTFVQITGVQTRYLLAAFFGGMVLAAGLIGKSLQLQYTQRTRLQKTPPEWRMVHIAFVFAVGSAVLLFQSYYIGA